MPNLSEYIKETFKSNFSYTEEAEGKDFIQLCQTESEPAMLLPAIHFYGFLLACIFTRSYLAFKNDATEILYSHVVKPAAASPSSNSTLNQARNGGRHYTSTGSDRNSEYPTGGTSTAAVGGSPAWPGPGSGRGSGARPEPRIPRQRPGPPARERRSREPAPGGSRATARCCRFRAGICLAGRPPSTPPSHPRAGKSCRTGSRAGYFLREVHPGMPGSMASIRQGREIKKKERGISRELAFFVSLPTAGRGSVWATFQVQ